MKAYVCTIGERTTEVCIEQLLRYGFEVVVLDQKEPWEEKYKRFIETAHESCIRVDADVIVNKKVVDAYLEFLDSGMLISQFAYFDFYRNDVWVGNPLAYSKEALEIIRSQLAHIDPRRPETWASRLPEINPNMLTSKIIVGMHGFFQDDDTFRRAKNNKSIRGQLDQYDFDLAARLQTL